MNIDGHVQNKLKQLRLTGMLETLPIRIKEAENSNIGYLDFLITLLEDEYERRQARGLLKRLKKAGFEEEKTLPERPIYLRHWDMWPAEWDIMSSLQRL